MQMLNKSAARTVQQQPVGSSGAAAARSVARLWQHACVLTPLDGAFTVLLWSNAQVLTCTALCCQGVSHTPCGSSSGSRRGKGCVSACVGSRCDALVCAHFKLGCVAAGSLVSPLWDNGNCCRALRIAPQPHSQWPAADARTTPACV